MLGRAWRAQAPGRSTTCPARSPRRQDRPTRSLWHRFGCERRRSGNSYMRRALGRAKGHRRAGRAGASARTA